MLKPQSNKSRLPENLTPLECKKNGRDIPSKNVWHTGILNGTTNYFLMENANYCKEYILTRELPGVARVRKTDD